VLSKVREGYVPGPLLCANQIPSGGGTDSVSGGSSNGEEGEVVGTGSNGEDDMGISSSTTEQSGGGIYGSSWSRCLF